MNQESTLEVLSETAYAEQGSALEMLSACKNAHKSTHAYGYFEHARDEYNHAKTFLEILSKKTSNFSIPIVRKYRFSP